jgi:hypothetical protein
MNALSLTKEKFGKLDVAVNCKDKYFSKFEKKILVWRKI